MEKRQVPDDATLDEMLESYFEKGRQEIFDICMEKLHINDDKRTMRFWKREVNLDDLLDLDLHDVPFEFLVDRDPCTGEVLGYREVVATEESGTGKTSLSLKRAPGPSSEGIMGSASKLPFFPGGMEEVFQEALRKQRETMNEASERLDFENNLLSIPPGFEKGVDFKDKKKAADEEKTQSKSIENAPSSVRYAFDENADILSIMDMISGVGDLTFALPEVKVAKEAEKKMLDQTITNRNEELDRSLEEVIAKPVPMESVAKRRRELEGRKLEYAEILDVNQPVKDFREKVPVLAFQHPFELDTFQKQAVIHLERGDSVFVAAHTSAGKTVVAEYAIALCKKHLTRAIYTSPIKALSNQKFRDFKQTFDDVGLITGDIQLNSDAFCLIMTTEILRSMLYNGSDVIREVEWVIFDEVHYINDKERGVVWEEVLIMLPRHIKIIMLSATVPNYADFADWVGRIKDRKVYVISTPKRPVPLEHFLYTGKDRKSINNRFLIVDKKGALQMKGYNLSMDSLKDKPTTGPKTHVMYNPKSEKNIWITLIDHLQSNDLLPVVAFTFSRKKCDDNAEMLTSINLTTAQEKTEIHFLFTRCMQQLNAGDRKLPQVLKMQEYCKRGLAVHHSGILPILKEAVEILFQRGYVKVLFATETFAMGVNMPARTVVFDSMQKHDGRARRDLNPGEYTQMAGRAGRRGKDTTGTVILLCKGDVPELSELNKMMLGKPEPLESKFRITYGLLLNSLRVERIRMEEVLQRSFAENVTLRNAMKIKMELVECKAQLDEVETLNCAVCIDLPNYYELCQEIVRLTEKILRHGFYGHPMVSKLLTPGHLVLFSQGRLRNCVGLIVKVRSDTKSVDLMILDSKEADYVFDIESDERALSLFDTCFLRDQLAEPTDVDTKYSVKNVPMDRLSTVSPKVIRVSPEVVLDDWQRRQQPRFRNDSPDRAVGLVAQELRHLITSGPAALQFLDPAKDVQYQDVDIMMTARTLKTLRSNLANFECMHCLSFKEHFLAVHRKWRLSTKYNDLLFQSSSESLLHMADYKEKLEVLKRLGYIDDNNIVTLKGKVACSLNVFELTVTELIFNNVINGLEPAEIAAALSFTTCQGVQKMDDQHLRLPDNLMNIRCQVDGVANRILDLHHQFCKSNQDVGEDMKELRFELMEVVYEWARGTPFCKIMEITDAHEGIIVRCIQRLNEVCRDVRNAARLVGDPTLQQKMEEVSTLIKRDIVFAASLYTTKL